MGVRIYDTMLIGEERRGAKASEVCFGKIVFFETLADDVLEGRIRIRGERDSEVEEHLLFGTVLTDEGGEPVAPIVPHGHGQQGLPSVEELVALRAPEAFRRDVKRPRARS